MEAKKTIPSWFKNMPAPVFTGPDNWQANLKVCKGFTETYKHGFDIPLWSDLWLEIGEKGTENYRWKYSDECSEIETHPSNEWGNRYAPTEYQHLKLISPWFLTCEEEVNFLAMEPPWLFDELGNISILPGVVNFKFQPTTHINLFFRREQERQEVILQAGMPVYHYVPLTERKVRIETHLISYEEFCNIRRSTSSIKFINHYGAREKITKERGCPYKFNVTKQ